MATKCREPKRPNRHKVKMIQAYTVIVILMLIGGMVGLFIGRITAPIDVVVETRTVSVEVPEYEEDALPEVEDVTYFDVPLSHSLQRFIYEVCADEEVPVTLVIAMIDHESQFDQEVVSDTDDYGLMQINEINHDRLAEEYQSADMLNAYQNVFCGIKIIASYIEEYGDYGKALMAYNMGAYGAEKAWENGITSSSYSESILELMSEYEQEVTENATDVVAD